MVQPRAPLQGPPRQPPRIDQWQQEQNLFLTVPVVLPPGDNLYDLVPQAVARLAFYSADISNLLFFPDETFPAGDQFYDRQQPPPYYRDWSVNLLQTTLKPAPQKPFAQYDWPLPIVAGRIDEFWSVRLTDKIGTDVIPHTQYDWPVPPRVNWYQDHSVNLLLTTLFVTPVKPVSQYDWPVPRAAFRPDFSYIQNLIPQNYTFQMAPTMEWALPPEKVLTDGWIYTWIYYSQFMPTLMAPNADWPYPERVTWYQDYNTNGYTPLKLVKPPFFNSDWQLPQRISWYQDWNTNAFALYRSSGPIPKSTDGSIPIRTLRDAKWDWGEVTFAFPPRIALGMSPNMEWVLTDAPENRYRDYSFNGVIRFFQPAAPIDLHFKPIQTNEGRVGNLGGLS